MALILNLETSTQVCSVCLSRGSEIIAWKEDFEGKNHAKLLTIFIEEVLKESGIKAEELDAIAVSKGPGSYTGLRIGVSTAKGLAFALSIPLISVNTLKMLAAGYLLEYETLREKENLLLIPMIDARRMEVYSAIYNTKLEECRKVEAEIIDEKTYSDLIEKNRLIIMGDGADKCSDYLKNPNISIASDFFVSAKYMAQLSSEKYEKKNFEDVAYFEPFYLKDFVAIIPKKSIL
ncbi:MAG: tRNA (adenosine(37)-N6)-threonylcarbamoyltransferase complex dimerization subunit type 1 TsaB [Bacteroidales bacterium]|nr:tRNA (adenosine(37)-N6)-threonylcarbamoyltransferase complex dimerization subunit type 1 TsaB [Bacteroidales bacterium]MCF8391955.1 tRNA (adenosine(37)-N6)-threonylcarbamoyltransferase complex dimerization subunit type 1 TsaB [Bacteroidales bacterium]